MRSSGSPIALGPMLFVAATTLIAGLLGPVAALAEVQFFHSEANTGTATTTPVTIEAGAIRSLHLYVESKGTPSSDPDSRCDSGDGGELCGHDIWLQASGTLSFIGFVPDPAADVTFTLFPGDFRANLLDPIAPTLGLLRIGELQVQADATSCVPPCEVQIAHSIAVGAALQVFSTDTATPTSTLVTVPEPSVPPLIAIGCLALAGLASRRGRARRSAYLNATSISPATGSSARSSSVLALYSILFFLAIGPVSARAVTLQPGDLVLADSGANQVFLIDPVTGAQTSVWTAPAVPAPPGAERRTRSIALDALGRLYVGDSNWQQIHRVDPATGNFELVTQGLSSPYGIVVDESGNLLVASANGDAVVHVDTSTAVGVQTIISAGAYIDGPQGIAFDPQGKLVLACDPDPGSTSDIARIVRVDPITGDQTLIAQGAPLVGPYGVAVAANGEIFVADSDANAVFRIEPGGVPTELTSGGFLGRPRGITIEPGGMLVVTDSSNDSLVRIDPTTGTQLEVVSAGGSLASPRELLAVPGVQLVRDTIIVADSAAPGLLLGIDPSSGAQRAASVGGAAASPLAVTMDANGIIYLASPGPEIYKVDPATGEQTLFYSGGPLIDIAGMALDPDGNLLAVDSANFAYTRIAPDGSQLPLPLGLFLTSATGVALDPIGQLWVSGADATPDGAVMILDHGIPVGFLTVPGTTLLGLAIDRRGAVYAIERTAPGPGRVLSIDPQTGSPTTLADGVLGGVLEDPTGIALDRNGFVFVSYGSAAGAGVVRIDPSNGAQVVVSSGGAPGFPLASPVALAIRNDGPTVCGNLVPDDTVDAADLGRLRAHLANPLGDPLTPEEQEVCAVRGPGGACDLATAVVLARHDVGLGPGIENACAPFSDEDLDGYSAYHGDCDPDDATVHPNAQDSCDSIDNDCDGEVDEGEDVDQCLTFYTDLDGDTWVGGDPRCLCKPQPSHLFTDFSDCNESEPDVYVDALVTCIDRDTTDGTPGCDCFSGTCNLCSDCGPGGEPVPPDPSNIEVFVGSCWDFRIADGPPDVGSDGCSGVADAPLGPLGPVFGEETELARPDLPCNAHDICYSTCGQTKEDCDDQFLTDMNQACLDFYPIPVDPNLALCLAAAVVYHEGVASPVTGFPFDAAWLGYWRNQMNACTCCVDIDGTGPDSDGDGVLDDDELVAGTDPQNPDTDGDGLSDGVEINTHGTDPRLADTDGDGLSDFDEIVVHATSPFLADSDGDFWSDADEVLVHGTDPNDPGDAPPFDPTALAGLVLWLEAADLATLTLNGAEVVGWDDKSPDAHALSPDGLGPVLVPDVLAGTPVLRFADQAESSLCSDADVDLTSGATLFVLARNRVRGLNGLFQVGDGIQNAVEFYWEPGTTDLGSGNLVFGADRLLSDPGYPDVGAFFATADSPPAVGEFYVATAVVDSVSVPGELRTKRITHPNASVFGFGFRPSSLGSACVGIGTFGPAPFDLDAAHLDGDIAEVVVFDRALAPSERNRMESYLSDKLPLECSEGLTNCSNECVNLFSDPNHCGACDNVCGGGVCADGICPVGPGG